jgi:rubrerythrin
MEPVRPHVDAFALDLVERRTFRKVEFIETSDGHVRLRSPLTHELAATMPQWAKSLGPIAEHVADVFGKAMAGIYSAATPLTRDRTRAAQAVVKARKASARSAATSTTALQKPRETGALPLWTCPDCGGAVTNPRHVRCEVCIDADPAQAPEIRGRRGAAIAARKRALSEWEMANPGATYDPELYRREILPKLAGVKLAEIVEAIGCSKASASDIRRGKRTPHVSTWPALLPLCRDRLHHHPSEAVHDAIASLS